MNTVQQPVSLEGFKELFKDSEAFCAFVDRIRTLCQKNSTVLLHEGEVVGTILSAGGTKELLYERLLRRISENPEIIEELADRLENDETVD